MVTGNQLLQAKEIIKKKGWSQRGAAKQLGYTWTHFCFVLTGRRASQRLLERIANELPTATPELTRRKPRSDKGKRKAALL
jgi:hypothetical protein